MIERAVLGLSIGEKVRLVERVIWALPFEARRDIGAREFSKGVLEAARVAELGHLVAAMAQGMTGSLSARAAAVHVHLSRYAASAWRRDRTRGEPADPRHFLAHRFLRLNDGNVLSASRIRHLGWLRDPHCDSQRGAR